jgi:hypothetical protein
MSETKANAALVECILKRAGGSKVEMADGTTYHFTPDQEGRHVAVVQDMSHVTRFMQIPEGYRILELISMAEAAKEVVEPIKSGAITPAAPAAPAAPAKAEATQPVQAEVAQALPQPAEDGVFTDEQVATIRAIFEKELNRAPHHKAKPETMVAQIEAGRAERAAA